jgi:hypothetical protein
LCLSGFFIINFCPVRLELRPTYWTVDDSCLVNPNAVAWYVWNVENRNAFLVYMLLYAFYWFHMLILSSFEEPVSIVLIPLLQKSHFNIHCHLFCIIIYTYKRKYMFRMKGWLWKFIILSPRKMDELCMPMVSLACEKKTFILIDTTWIEIIKTSMQI